MEDNKKLTKEQMIKIGCAALIFVAGFYCGCKYTNIDRAFKALLKKPNVEVIYF